MDSAKPPLVVFVPIHCTVWKPTFPGLCGAQSEGSGLEETGKILDM